VEIRGVAEELRSGGGQQRNERGQRQPARSGLELVRAGEVDEGRQERNDQGRHHVECRCRQLEREAGRKSGNEPGHEVEVSSMGLEKRGEEGVLKRVREEDAAVLGPHGVPRGNGSLSRQLKHRRNGDDQSNGAGDVDAVVSLPVEAQSIGKRAHHAPTRIAQINMSCRNPISPRVRERIDFTGTRATRRASR
jgi:hypothetical protein